ncbi:hypothetical protein Tco_1128206 [Tanacetum coccineum]
MNHLEIGWGIKEERKEACSKGWEVQEEVYPHTQRAATKVPVQEEPIPRKRYHEGMSSRRTKSFSKSGDSRGGHWKSRSKKQKSSIEEDDLSQPWVCQETGPFTPRIQTGPFTPRIRYFNFPKKTRMPSNVKTYDGSEDLEDHLKIFQAAANVEH